MTKKNDEETVVKSLSIPGNVRDQLADAAASRGISRSALMRLIAEDYVSGRLKVQPEEDPEKIVRTSVWMPKKLWGRFTARTERDGVPTQLVMRVWLRQNQA